MSDVLDRSRIQLAARPRLPAPRRPTPPPRRGTGGPGHWLSRWVRHLRDLLEKLPKPRWRHLPLTVEIQLQTQWCWAACSASVSHFYDPGSSWTQCTVVNAELGQTGCCRDGSSGQCNRPWYLDLALARTGSLATWTDGTAPLPTIRSQIDAARPVGARIGWASGGGHFVMISGFLDDATGLLEVRDPIFGTSEISIASFASSYQGSGSWTHTYYTKD